MSMWGFFGESDKDNWILCGYLSCVRSQDRCFQAGSHLILSIAPHCSGSNLKFSDITLRVLGG